MQLSPNFTLEELTRSDTARAKGIDNTPSSTELANLRDHVAPTLERIRNLCGAKPVNVSSGFRCVELNRAIGGSITSAHTRGLAADFTVKGMDWQDVFDLIRASDIPYDQLIFEHTWVHIGLDASMRRQNLIMYKDGGVTRYKPAP